MMLLLFCFTLLHPTYALVNPSPFPTQKKRIHALRRPLEDTRRGLQFALAKTFLASNTNAVSFGNVNTAQRRLNLALLKEIFRRPARLFHNRGLPRSNVWTIPDNAKTLRHRAVKFFTQFILETSCVASILSIFSVQIFGEFNRKFAIINLIRWMTVSLFYRLIMLHSCITSSVPSTARNEGNGWFLQGSYHMHWPNQINGGASFIPVKIRQVPGNGSCLFHSIAAGIMYDQSLMKNENGTHPSMSQVIERSATLRRLAVDTLEEGCRDYTNNYQSAAADTDSIMQNNETISASSLVRKAATQYSMTSEEYLANMRQENVWGGGPEIVALANHLKRPIVLLEAANMQDGNERDKGKICNEDAKSICLEVIARFGPPSKATSICILSTNQKFPTDYCDKAKNHFLAVFPSHPL